jgi:cysteinyl-tRNA synthetase
VTDHKISLYNTLTREKAPFVPIDPSNVRMYVCGPTVYDYAHIGNARPVIVFDVLFRLLRHVYPGKGSAIDGSRVTYARNITDVDDKINARAAEEYPKLPLNEAIAEVTSRTTAQFHEDIGALGVLPPTIEPRCTQHIAHMVRMIETLIAKGCAYEAEGHVLLDTQRVPDYGALSRRSLDDMIAGARVEVAPYKRHPADSVLWKPSSDELPGWDSPWGRGRPGWHIECSAMSAEHLGEVFDIHGGGIDLVFPHHENEVAQSRCAHGTDVMANVWMHNGFLQVEGEKMSKSLGNFLTINELLREWPGSTMRLAMLTTHYREPIDWTRRALDQADLELSNWAGGTEFANEAHQVSIERKNGSYKSQLPEEFLGALCDDLNTPKALTVLRQFAAKSDRTSDDARSLYLMAEFLGLVRYDRLGIHTRPVFRGALGRHDIEATMKLRAAVANDLVEQRNELRRHLIASGINVRISPDGWLSVDATDSEITRDVQSLVDARLEARKAKNFAESDRIRDELAKMGIALKDGKDPNTGEPITTWEVKR